MTLDRPYAMATANLARRVRVLQLSPEGAVSRADAAATEEPMEVRLGGEPFAVIMRTPGSDRELAAGFLFAERVILSAEDIDGMERLPESGNVLDVRIRTRQAPPGASRRRVAVSSSCGLCGRVTIASLRVEAPEIQADWTIPSDVIETLPRTLRRAQAVFNETGGLHAAGLFDRSGSLEVIAEDVGRHNAVDKVIGRMLLEDQLPLDRFVLFVSGRTSYEILQKAFLAGIPVVGAVSAPSSLAIELAEEAGITLLGFVRGGSCNVYSHPRRIARAPAGANAAGRER
jgi:FdhD protein